jgi:membrane fusion protein (multidrug efflux system)
MKMAPLFSARLLSAAALVAVMATGCGDGEAAPKADSEEKAAVALRIHVATLEQTDFVDLVTVYGQVEARESVNISAEVPGRIDALPFAEGASVQKGQTLIRINARTALAQLQQAQAAHDLAQTNLKRTRAMVGKSVATQSQLDQAVAQAAQAEAGLELARAGVDKAIVRAPFSGEVSTQPARVGEIAAPGMPLVSLVDIGAVDVAAEIPEQDIPYLEVGAEVQVMVDAYGDRIFTGQVRHVALAANPTTRTFTIKIRLENPDRALRPGMLAKVQVTRRAFEDVVVAPRDAILDELAGNSAFVLQGNEVQTRTVSLGPTRGDFVVVDKGLAAGDQLVVLGHRQVVHGQKVEVAKRLTCCRAQAGIQKRTTTASSGEKEPAPEQGAATPEPVKTPPAPKAAPKAQDTIPSAQR